MKIRFSISRTFSILFITSSFLLRSVDVDASQNPSFENPTSQMPTEEQFYSPAFKFWCSELKQSHKFHRKLWEFCYILQVLYKYGYLQPGKKGIGFGVGSEPLPALFAKYGCEIVATDQDFESALNQGWAIRNQPLSNLDRLNQDGICPQDQFIKLVSFRTADMRKIDKNLRGFDFTWSACSLEHLGSLEAGLDFIEESMKCLKKGGIAVHTTEFNVSSDNDTISKGATVLYRKQDIIRLTRELEALGYEVLPLNFNLGNGNFDNYVDVAPYHSDPHLKLKIGEYTCTSFGIVVIKK